MQRHLGAEATARAVLVTGGTGTGSTRLTAFDAALQDAGIHNANLIRVSSITPASADTRRPSADELARQIEPGEYFPAVYAWEAASESGQRVTAAVAGVRLAAGYGLNVEYHGHDVTAESARRACVEMLEEMADRRSQEIDGEPWVRCESSTAPESDAWGAAVAAILYAK